MADSPVGRKSSWPIVQLADCPVGRVSSWSSVQIAESRHSEQLAQLAKIGRVQLDEEPVSRQTTEQTGGGEACSGVLIVDFWTFELCFSRHPKFWIFSRCRQSPIKNCKKFPKLLKLSIRALNLCKMSYMLKFFPQSSNR